MNELDEIKQILKQLSVSQAKNDQQIAEDRAAQAKGFAKLRAAQAKTDAQIAELRASQDESKIRNDKAFDDLRDFLKEVGRQLGEVGHNNGDFAEDFFFGSFEHNMNLGSVHFDAISRNLKSKKHRLEDEYDIVLENGDCVALIEVKYKVQPQHIKTLTTKKVENFRTLFPDYAKYKIYTGIAGLSFTPAAERLAHECGTVVIKQKGKHMEVDAENMQAF